MRLRIDPASALMPRAVMAGGYLVLAMVALMLLWAPTAEAGSLANVSDTVTDPSPGAVTIHQIAFTTATTVTVDFVTFAFPSGFDVTSTTLGLTSGIGAGALSAPSATSLCYTIASPATIAAGTVIAFQFNGVVNPATAGSRQITITTLNANAQSCSSNKPNQKTDTGTATVVIGDGASISATSQKVFVFSVGAGSVAFSLDPATSPAATATITLSVETNTSTASGGYVVTARIGQALQGTAYSGATVPSWTGTAAGPTPWDAGASPNYWGITRSAFPNDGGSYFGLSTTPQAVMSASGPTNGDVQTQTWRVAVDYTTPADTYTTTVYFVGTPSF